MKLSKEDVVARLLTPLTLKSSLDYRGRSFSKCLLTIEDGVDLSGCVFYKCYLNVDVGGVINIDPLAKDFDYTFSHKVLDQLELEGFDFSNTDLSLAEIRDSNLRNCTFRNTEFANTTFVKSVLSDCNFKDILFHNCTFEGVDFTNGGIRDCTFRNCKFDEDTYFQFIRLDDVHFEDCDIGTESLEVCSSCGIVHLETDNYMNYTNWGDTLCGDCSVECENCGEYFTQKEFQYHNDCYEEDDED